MRYDVHARRVKPTEERLVVRLRLLDERQGEVANLIIDGLHPFWIKRTGIFDLLFTDLAPARHHSGVVRGCSPGVDHVAWPNHVQQILRIVRMRRVFHRVEVIKISEELVEAVDGRQELIQIAEMVLAELAGSIALRFKRGSNCASLSWYADLGTRLADRGHAGTDGQLAHDEVCATCRATGLSVIVGE